MTANSVEPVRPGWNGLPPFDLTRSFPATVHRAASDVARLLDGESQVEARDGARFNIGDETVQLPSRLYMSIREMDDATREWDDGQQDDRTDLRYQVALCLGTRHHDGFLRESCLRRLGVPDAEWKLPFVAVLLGELVDEIACVSADLLAAAPRDMVLGFTRRNLPAMQTFRRRAISYWDCYYRRRYRTYPEVPAVALLDELLASVKAPP